MAAGVDAPPEAMRAPMPKARSSRGRLGECGSRLQAEDSKNHVPKVVVDLDEMCEATMELVLLHVYDLAPNYLEYWRTRLPTYSPFHTAIEVCGKEHSFGWNLNPGFAEVVSAEPRRHPEHKFRLTISMGYSTVPPREIVRTLSQLKEEWNNHTFNLHTRNTHHFSETLCGRLGVKPLPQWIHDNISTERVFLRVYNLGQTFITRWHNSLVKSYGAFHTGVEVYGREWCFGATQDDSSGVGWLPPGECEQHDFRESLYMGSTACSKEQVEDIIAQLSVEWSGSSYDMLRRNCHNFSEALCDRLGVSRPPAWVNELASALASTGSPPNNEDKGA